MSKQELVRKAIGEAARAAALDLGKDLKKMSCFARNWDKKTKLRKAA